MSVNQSTDEPATMVCEDVRDLLFLHACNELDPDEKGQIDTHLEDCEGCRKAREEHDVLRRVLPTGYIDRKLFYYSVDA